MNNKEDVSGLLFVISATGLFVLILFVLGEIFLGG
jgi:hypothetical protein